MSKSFTQAEAEAKVGARICTKVEFSGVPKGTVGTVVKADNMGGGQWDAVIEWKLPDRPFGTHAKPLQDWFTKDEYEKYLEET